MNKTSEELADREPQPESSVVSQVGPKKRRSLKTPVIAAVAVVALIALAFVLWRYFGSSSGQAGRPVPLPRSIATDSPVPTTTAEATITLDPAVLEKSGIKVDTVGEQVAVRSDETGIVSTGVVQPNAYRTTPVISLVGGIVRQVNVELGNSVRQGQPLAFIRSDELATAQTRYLNALADLEEHHKHHLRTSKLVEIGAASREELEQATTKYKTAESEVASQRQRLLLLGLSSGRIAQLRSPSQINLEIALPAPVSGLVIARSANPGEVIAADKELLRIADLSTVWIQGQVYEKDLAKVVVGSGANITVDSYPGRVFRGRVSYIDPTLDPSTRTAQARIELPNPGQALKIGMFANVAFAALGVTDTVAVIPKAAVQTVNNRQVVFVETGEGNVFAMRPVKLGAETNGIYSVLEGVSPGQRIVTSGSFMLRAEWLKTNPTSHQH
jgi:membrane fusion protein, heavy metal efflux system